MDSQLKTASEMQLHKEPAPLGLGLATRVKFGVGVTGQALQDTRAYRAYLP